MTSGVVIAGGGLAAQRCAEALRRGGWEGPLRIVGEEAMAPYDRPPLSKGFLSGDLDPAEIALRPAGWHAEQGVELLLGDPASGLDPDRRLLLLASGATLPFEHLVIATGGRARELPGAAGLANVHRLRSIDDAARLRAALLPGARLAVLGAGLIGQEVAATASARGVRVTLIEAEPLPLARALHPRLASWLVDLQRAHGVDVRLGTRLERLESGDSRLEALHLSDGSRLEVDALLVAIGVVPATGWVGADVHQLARAPHIHVAGDASGANHWEAAVHQGRAAAGAILGGAAPAPALTSWWSDVHGVRLQGLGDPVGSDALVVDGDPRGRSFTAVALRRGSPVAALAAGRPRELPRLRKLLTDVHEPAKEAA